MTRDEFIRRLVLDQICDDYENVDQTILGQVSEDGARCGLTIKRTEVIAALEKLIALGLVRAYDLSCRPGCSAELDGMPGIMTIEEDFRTYFLATDEGIELQLSDDTWWPFNETPPSA